MNNDTAHNLIFLQSPTVFSLATMTLPALFSLACIASAADPNPLPASAPIRALLVTGGRYHDYNGQSKFSPRGSAHGRMWNGRFFMTTE